MTDIINTANAANENYNLPQPVDYSLLTSEKSQTKAISLQPDGSLLKEYAEPMVNGTVVRKSAKNLQEVADAQNAIQNNEAHCNGVVIGSTANVSLGVVTKNKVDDNPGCVARSNQYFERPKGLSLFTIDIDKHPNLTAEECLKELFKAIPELLEADYIKRPSCSSYIRNESTGEFVTNLNGIHLTYVVSSNDVDTIAEYIDCRLWLTGHGYVTVSQVGSLLVRTLIDCSIYQPCRLEFLAPATCIEPLKQQEIKSEVIRSKKRLLCMNDFEQLTDSEKTAVKQLKQAAKDKKSTEAEKQRTAFIQSRIEACPDVNQRMKLQQSLEKATASHTLPSDWILYVYDGSLKPTPYTVKDIIANPKRFNGLKTAELFDHSYKNGAITGWLNLKDGRCNLYDFHSGICFGLGEESHDSIWNEPVRLNEPIGNHYPFPVDEMPLALKEAVIEIAKNNKVDPALVAVSAISAASLGCQMLANVSRKPFVNEPSPISVYTLVKAESGERKSRIDTLLYKTYHDFVLMKRQDYDNKMETYKRAYELWKIESDAASQALSSLIKRKADPKKGNQVSDADIAIAKASFEEISARTPTKPLQYELFVSDFTSEKLIEMVAENGNIGVVSDEGGRVFSCYSFGKDHVTKTASDLNSLWAGSPFSVKRKTSESFDLDGSSRVLMAIMCQPKIVEQFIVKNNVAVSDSGFLPRFLICQPPSTQGTRFITDVKERSTEKLEALRHVFAVFIRATDDLLQNGKEPVILYLSKEALPGWVNYYNKVENATNNEYSSIKAFASKAAEQAVRIASIYHLVENVNRIGNLPLEISLENINRAVATVEWFMNEALILMGNADSSWRYNKTSDALERMVNYCVNHNTDHIAKGKLSGILKVDVKEYNQYLELLALQECVKVEHSKIGKAVTIWINPVLLGDRKKNNQNKIVDLPTFSVATKTPETASNSYMTTSLSISSVSEDACSCSSTSPTDDRFNITETDSM